MSTKSGRRNKGERGFISVRPPTDHLAEYDELARDLGIPLGDYAVMRLAQAHGLPVPEYIEEEISRAASQRDAAADVLDIEGGVVPLARSA